VALAATGTKHSVAMSPRTGRRGFARRAPAARASRREPRRGYNGVAMTFVRAFDHHGEVLANTPMGEA
jgi:hypothetical protein